MKKAIITIAFLASSLLTPIAVYAHCPLCTAAVGAGVVATRYYGVDDSIVGLFVGAFIISTALWFDRSLKKKYIPFQEIVISILSLGLSILGFYAGGLMTGAYEKVFGVDKLLFGIILGGVGAYVGLYLSKAIKRLNSDKVLFPFQTIAVILGLLSVLSVILFLAI